MFLFSFAFRIFDYRIADPSQRENLGIIVQYKVKVKLCIGGPILGGYVCYRISVSIDKKKKKIHIHCENGLVLTNHSKLYMCFNRDLVAELPFILMHPKPEEEEANPILSDRSPGKQHSSSQRTDDANENASSQATTGNLIQLDGYAIFLSIIRALWCSVSYSHRLCLNFFLSPL